MVATIHRAIVQTVAKYDLGYRTCTLLNDLLLICLGIHYHIGLMFSSELHPFDGSCELSKKADLTIVFDGDFCNLKADARMLSLASPILHTAIEECEHLSVLNVDNDNHKAWIVLLNTIHPLGPIFRSRSIIFSTVDDFVTLAIK